MHHRLKCICQIAKKNTQAETMHAKKAGRLVRETSHVVCVTAGVINTFLRHQSVLLKQMAAAPERLALRLIGCLIRKARESPCQRPRGPVDSKHINIPE